jgi:hypothetical protein
MAGFGLGNYLSPQVGGFIDSRRNALAGLGAGLLNGQPGAGVQAGLQADDAYATQQKAEAERQKAIADQTALRAKYADFFTQQGRPEIAQGIADGALDYKDEYIKHITPKGPIKASEGDVFLDPTTYQPVGGVPPKPTSAIQEYNFAKSQGYQGTFQQYETDMKKAGATNIDFNANQGNAAGFADRMASANAIISDPKIEAAMLDLVKKGAAGIPVAGNFLVGPEFQQAEQAKRDFVNAILRRESGAVISPSEFENANQQYFPQPGDSPEVIAQKAANRQIAIEGVQRAAGPNYAAPSLTPPGVVAPQTTSTGVQWSIEP